MDSEEDSFYIAIRHPEGDFKGFAVARTLEQLEAKPPKDGEKRKPAEAAEPPKKDTFRDVLKAFRSTISTYRSFLNLMIAMAPAASALLAERTIKEFVKRRGRKREDLSSADKSVFELTTSAYRELAIHREEITAAGAA
jgi:hypothetical protein